MSEYRTDEDDIKLIVLEWKFISSAWFYHSGCIFRCNEFKSQICRVEVPHLPEAAIAYDQLFLRDLYSKRGLCIARIIHAQVFDPIERKSKRPLERVNPANACPERTRRARIQILLNPLIHALRVHPSADAE